jgi:hypothetical protein
MSGGANILTQHPGHQENSLVSATDLKTELPKSLRRRDSESKPHVFFISAVGEMNGEPHALTALLQQIGDTLDEHGAQILYMLRPTRYLMCVAETQYDNV